MAEEKKQRRKPFTEELEDAILAAGFPVVKGDGTIVTPEDQSDEEQA